MTRYTHTLRTSPSPELAELLTEADYNAIIESDKAAHALIWQEGKAAHGIRTTAEPPGTTALVLEEAFQPYMQVPLDQLKVFFFGIEEKMKARYEALVAEMLPRSTRYERGGHQDADGRAVLETLTKLYNNTSRLLSFEAHKQVSVDLKMALDAACEGEDSSDRIA